MSAQREADGAHGQGREGNADANPQRAVLIEQGDVMATGGDFHRLVRKVGRPQRRALSVHIGMPVMIIRLRDDQHGRGGLTNLEREIIKTHCKVANDILANIEFPYPVAEIIYQHHERMDGSGYPRGLKGDDIALEARIIGVADVIDAMASYRPYRPALGVDAAIEEITKFRGVTYDPSVVDACLKIYKRTAKDSIN